MAVLFKVWMGVGVGSRVESLDKQYNYQHNTKHAT